MSDRREERLPKWAQEELRILRAEAQRWKDKYKAHSTLYPDSDTFLIDYVSGDVQLPPNSGIGFKLLPNADEWRAHAPRTRQERRACT
ncbi:hypothetical protein ACFQ8S_06765 [Streptomyces virginiae]|uniref:DUF7239 family protein n=1 Tax=Streptomyces virginiae TaxID=1961 RepID=UPI0036C28482